MSPSLLPDPRFERMEAPVYDRAVIITAITEFYNSLVKLPHVSPTDFLYPPLVDWPSITPYSFAPVKKSTEVIELLKQLPYLRSSPAQNRGEENVIAWDTKPIDYREERFQEESITEEMEVFTPHKYEFPE